jgi:hypothetical protein
LTLSAAASAARGLILVLIVVGAGWGMFEVVRRIQRGATGAGAPAIPDLARGEE